MTAHTVAWWQIILYAAIFVSTAAVIVWALSQEDQR